eukprot:978989-Amphidinium_carterae.1
MHSSIHGQDGTCCAPWPIACMGTCSAGLGQTNDNPQAHCPATGAPEDWEDGVDLLLSRSKVYRP